MAIKDDRVDGGDTQVFASGLEVVNPIQGPLFIEGSFVDEDVSDLWQFDPVRLPGETNITDILLGASNDGMQVTVETLDIANFGENLEGFTLRVYDQSGKEQRRTIVGSTKSADGTKVVLTVDYAFDPLPVEEDSTYVVTRTNINFFVNEKDQVDALFVYHNDSVANNTGLLSSIEVDNEWVTNLSGLGMGVDRN